MQIINNYDREWEKYSELGYATYGSGVFNGDMGRIEMINTEINEMYVMFDDGRRANYSYAELDEIVLSYALSGWHGNPNRGIYTPPYIYEHVENYRNTLFGYIDLIAADAILAAKNVSYKLLHF